MTTVVLVEDFSYFRVFVQLTGSAKPAYVAHKWSSLARPFRWDLLLWFCNNPHQVLIKITHCDFSSSLQFKTCGK